MSQKPLSFYGQINYTKLKAAMKSGHIKMQKIQTKEGEQIVFDLNVWVHEEADQYNNNASIQCSLKKEAFDNNVTNTFYIGNLKFKEVKVTEVSQEEAKNIFAEDEDDDLPF